MSHPGAPVESLLNLDFLRGLEPETVTRLLSYARYHRHQPGEALLNAGDEGLDVYFLVAGEIAVMRNGRLLQLMRAPLVLGLISVVDGRARSASLVAFSDVEVFSLTRSEFDELLDVSSVLDRNLIQWLAGELRQQHDANNVLMQHFEDFFSAPNARLVPGPYSADPYDMYFFVMKDDPARIKGVLPPGVSLLPGIGGRYMLTFNFFTRVHSRNPAANGRQFTYNETTPFIPCITKDLKAGVFCPELYPDNYLAITLGREMYGFPKRFANTRRQSDHIDLVIDSRLVLRAGWGEEKGVTAEAFVRGMSRALSDTDAMPNILSHVGASVLDWVTSPGHWKPSMPVFVHKQIPDCESAEEWVFEIDELVEIPFQIHQLTDFVELSAPDVQFFTNTWFLGGACEGAFRVRLAFGFGRGRERLNYRKPPPLRDRLRKGIRDWIFR